MKIARNHRYDVFKSKAKEVDIIKEDVALFILHCSHQKKVFIT